FYANSHGFIGHYPSSRHSVVCSVIAQDEQGMQRDYWYTASRNPKELESMRQIGETAAKRAVARLNARQLPTGQWPVLFTPDTAIGLVGHFIRGIRGGSLYRKTSFLLDSMGEQIFPDWIHMDEQPHIKAALGSAPFDSEGVATQSRDLVKAGVVQAYVLDTYSARRLNMETTGNAGGVHNLTLESSGHSYEDLLSQMGTGLIVTDLMGQGVNNVTGTYSRGAAGFWLENGEIQFPVHEITIASNLKEMFKGIIAVGNDMDHRRNIRTGSILVDKMTIAGE
ncbi:MAG: metallopeptidase TldD-related protein, partial [Gammaproteobacteria bacterium]|nr:metallopeptidase TldD-related protein [Gammaproteobacteria bacterium]